MIKRLLSLFKRDVIYIYYKSVTPRFYGLCGTSIDYIKYKRDVSAMEQMFTDSVMARAGYYRATKSDYERNNNEN